MKIPLFADPTLDPDYYQTLFDGLRKQSDILSDDEIRLFILALESCRQHFGLLPEEKMAAVLEAAISVFEAQRNPQAIQAVYEAQVVYERNH